jgi:phospholipid/cholesterol/gamma-HCH transport system permease protein
MPREFPFSQTLENIGDTAGFFGSFFRNIFKKGFEWDEFFRQAFMIGYKSIGIVLLTGFILGFVLTLQSLPTLKQFGTSSFAPGMVSVSMIREIGPVIIALICAGKIASGIGAELGSMNVTEQIDAMEVSGANPMQFLVVTRILVCTLMLPLLTVVADGVGMIGGYIGMNVTGHMSPQLYFSKSILALKFSDLTPAFIKTIFFGFTIGFVGCYKGFHSNRGTESVGLAANSSVVTASVCIILIDAIAVQITNIIVYK